jgi:hypothetical protein
LHRDRTDAAGCAVDDDRFVPGETGRDAAKIEGGQTVDEKRKCFCI